MFPDGLPTVHDPRVAVNSITNPAGFSYALNTITFNTGGKNLDFISVPRGVWQIQLKNVQFVVYGTSNPGGASFYDIMSWGWYRHTTGTTWLPCSSATSSVLGYNSVDIQGFQAGTVNYGPRGSTLMSYRFCVGKDPVLLKLGSNGRITDNLSYVQILTSLPTDVVGPYSVVLTAMTPTPYEQTFLGIDTFARQVEKKQQSYDDELQKMRKALEELLAEKQRKQIKMTTKRIGALPNLSLHGSEIKESKEIKRDDRYVNLSSTLVDIEDIRDYNRRPRKTAKNAAVVVDDTSSEDGSIPAVRLAPNTSPVVSTTGTNLLREQPRSGSNKGSAQ